MFSDVVGLGLMSSTLSASVPVTFKLGIPLFSTEQILYGVSQTVTELGRGYFRLSKNSARSTLKIRFFFENLASLKFEYLYDE